jgi:hypothetical protein
VNDGLSFNRLLLLIRDQILRRYRVHLIVSGVLALLAIVGPAGFGGATDIPVDFYRGFFIGVLFLWGTISTSLALTDLHDRTANGAFLLLPATALEKTLAPLLVNTVVFVVYLLVFTSALSLVGELLEWLPLGLSNEWFSPFDSVVWAVIPHYLVIQSVFFLGAAWFRKAHYVKTLLAIAVIATAIVAIYGAIFWVLGMGTGIVILGDAESSMFGPFSWLLTVAKLSYYVIVPLFCWFVAWLRVEETQVSHGV